MLNDDFHSFEKKRIRLAFIPSILFVTFVWLAFILDNSGVFGSGLSKLAILPGSLKGLLGIVFSPFLHSSFSHLWSNTLPLLILIWLLFYFYRNIAFPVFIYLWFLSGLLTWIIGRNSYHIGASGLVFAMLFFLFFSGIFRRYIPLIAVSLVVAFIYGSTIWSIFPIAEIVDVTISWEGHLSGAIGGFIISIVYMKQGPQRPVKVWEEELEEELEDDKIDHDLGSSI